MPFRKNLSLDAFIIAIFIGALDICIVAPSLTVIAADLGFPVRGVIWMIAIHLAVFVWALPLMESWGGRAGRKEWFLVSLLVYGVGSLIAGGSMTWLNLIVGRVIQALGAGGIVPLLSVEIRRLSHIKNRVWRVVIHIVLAVLLVSLPVFSSMVTWYFSWRWLFWIKIPAVLAVYALSFRFAQGGRTRRPLYQIHGVFYFGGILLSAMIAVSQIEPSKGWAALVDPGVLPFAVMALGLPVPLFMAERQASHPFFSNHLFSDFRLFLLHGVVALAGFTWVATVFLPGWMVEVHQRSPGTGGLFLSIVAASAWLTLPLARWASRNWGCQGMMAMGFVATAFAYATLALAVDPLAMTGVLILLGFGISLTLAAPVHTLLFQLVSFRYAKNGLMAIGMFRAAGGALGLILAGISFHQAAPFTGWISSAQGLPRFWGEGYQAGMLTAAGAAVLGLILTLSLPSEESRGKSGEN